MDPVNELLHNQVLISGVVAWVIAQCLKVIVNAIRIGKWDLKRILGDGGMPSAHSATVTGIGIAAGLRCGFDSVYFAIACILAIVVMHDAMGVRLEVSKQAKLLNRIMPEALGRDLSDDETLNVNVGHTPAEVVCGGIIGFIAACILNVIFK